ncbi:MAG: hypothetical protein IJL08_02330 [Oscillospiraceae bacterium]|nr:hypothetical protein [Oscillospiraceae bacterium]
MSATFKTCVFGGFDREDVISYIEKTAKENKEKLQELTDANEKLRQDNEAMSGELSALRESAGKYQAIAEEYEALRTQVAELTNQSRELQEKNEQLRVQADEYQSLRDHIAEIEISAHRRTQEFRSAAVEQLHGLVARQRDNYAQRRTDFASLYEGLRGQIQAAQDALGALDLSGFDSIDGQLQELDASLDE